MKIRSFLFLCVAAGMCFMSCRNGHTSGADAAPEATMPSDSMSVCKDRTVIVSETDSMWLYKPVFNGGVELLCEYDCHPAEGNDRIFVAAGAYTLTYSWSEFDHGLIAGPHVAGQFYEGYDEPAISGAFYYINSEKRWGFVHDGYEKTLREMSASQGQCVGFSQVMLISDGEICNIHPRTNPNKLRHRRAICEIDNDLYIVDSKHKITLFEFTESLKALGVENGLYMDMGRMRYSAYKEFASGEWTEIHPRNRVTKYCSNYLVFYR